MQDEKIVAGGFLNVRIDPKTQKKIDEAVNEVRARYEKKRKTGGLVCRLKQWLQMRKEIEAAVTQFTPSGQACYAETRNTKQDKPPKISHPAPNQNGTMC